MPISQKPTAHGGCSHRLLPTRPSYSELDASAPSSPQCSRWALWSLTGLQQESVAGTGWGHPEC